MKRLDLTGRRFGALTALYPIPSAEMASHRSGWMTRCDCGAEKAVDTYDLRRGAVTSCGCGAARRVRRSAAGNPKAIVDYTGQKFYELTAIERVGRGEWRFRCSCGNEIVARPATVKAGKIKSCGHILQETARQKIAIDGKNILGHFDGTTIAKLRAIMASPQVHGVRRVPRAAAECYVARIVIQRREIYLGHFPDYDSAAAARREAERKYYLPIIDAWEQKKGGQTP